MKKAIVVGASSGMGSRVAKLLLESGWSVGIAARRVDKLNEVFADYKNAIICRIDVTSDGAGDSLAMLADKLGGLDLYFHASGIGKQNKTLQPEIEISTVQTNGVGFVRMVTAAYNYMANHTGGHIAVISSIAGTKGLGPAPSYSATKALQNTYVQALEQLANMQKKPITFTDIRPGFVDTDLLSGDHYPMLMNPDYVARRIYKSIMYNKHVCIIDHRWAILVFLWHLVPGFIWRRLSL